MITKETAAKIAYAYSEIEAAEELLKGLADELGRLQEPDFRDNFGRRRGLQLGVPSGSSGHRLLDVAPRLAKIIIKAHIDDKKSEIEALCMTAKRELSRSSPESGLVGPEASRKSPAQDRSFPPEPRGRLSTTPFRPTA